MFILDTVALSPVRGVMWLARKVLEVAEQELEAEEAGITRELQRLYQQLEAGHLTAEAFDKKEAELLNRLDEIQALRGKNET